MAARIVGLIVVLLITPVKIASNTGRMVEVLWRSDNGCPVVFPQKKGGASKSLCDLKMDTVTAAILMGEKERAIACIREAGFKHATQIDMERILRDACRHGECFLDTAEKQESFTRRRVYELGECYVHGF